MSNVDASVQPYLTLTRLAGVYGPLYRLQLGSVPCVVLADTRLVKEVLGREEAAGRPPLYLFRLDSSR